MAKTLFLNLTNGIEYLPEVEDGVIHFMRIRSTTIERKDWLFLLMDLDHNFLLHLALGKDCVFVDYGTNRLNSKTVYYGIQLVRYVLSRRWFGIAETPYRLHRNSNGKIFDVESHFSHIYDTLFVHDQDADKCKLKKKLDYYKKFLNTSELKLSTISNSTTYDGNYPHYFEILKNNY